MLTERAYDDFVRFADRLAQADLGKEIDKTNMGALIKATTMLGAVFGFSETAMEGKKWEPEKNEIRPSAHQAFNTSKAYVVAAMSPMTSMEPAQYVKALRVAARTMKRFPSFGMLEDMARHGAPGVYPEGWVA